MARADRKSYFFNLLVRKGSGKWRSFQKNTSDKASILKGFIMIYKDSRGIQLYGGRDEHNCLEEKGRARMQFREGKLKLKDMTRYGPTRQAISSCARTKNCKATKKCFIELLIFPWNCVFLMLLKKQNYLEILWKVPLGVYCLIPIT